MIFNYIIGIRNVINCFDNIFLINFVETRNLRILILKIFFFNFSFIAKEKNEKEKKVEINFKVFFIL